jgi:regulator of sigma E protease
MKDESAKPQEPPTTETVTVDLPAQPLRGVGLVMEIGEITAIREGSPAAQAGLQPGDRLVSIAGEGMGDPLTLSQRLVKFVGTEIDVGFERTDVKGKMEQMTVKMTPVAPLQPANMGDFVSAEPLGVAYQVSHKVAKVVPGSEAEKAGFKPGAELVSIHFLPTDPKVVKEIKERTPGEKLLELKTLDPVKENWAKLHLMMQYFIPPGTKVELRARQNGSEVEGIVTLTPSNDGYVEQRGLNFFTLSETRVAASFSEAWYLGFRETKEKLVEVALILRGLFTGRISLTSFGGPISIFRVASHESSQGWPQLLVFLTYLSANLALINFLPIPVLDGGHMVFLAWEGITRKPPNEQLQGALSMAGLVFLLSLMVFVFGLDIVRLF